MKKDKKPEYDVFISYRRTGGFETAQLLYDRLSRLRYRVSFDIETLRSGKFDEQLYSRIEHCRDVLVVMSRNALEQRPIPEDDWLRLEVAHALKHHKNIIPVFLRDFDQESLKTLPKGDVLAEVCAYEGVPAANEHLDSTIAKIRRLLKSKPCLPFLRHAAWLLPVLLVVCAVLCFA